MAKSFHHPHLNHHSPSSPPHRLSGGNCFGRVPILKLDPSSVEAALSPSAPTNLSSPFRDLSIKNKSVMKITTWFLYLPYAYGS